jgi:predicted amidohydrolase YtcJ
MNGSSFATRHAALRARAMRISHMAYLALSFLGPFAPTVALATDSGPPTVIITNARVITLDDRSRIANAAAIRGDRILAVGTDAEIQVLGAPDTRVIDAGGKALLPGLYDSHVHPLGAATSEVDHPIPAFQSLADIKKYIADRVGSQPKGTWIVVRYAFPTRFDESRFPTKAELDEIAPDHPVLHQAGPAGMANSKALEVSGITKATPNPPAGQVVKDPLTGEPTGMIRNAYRLLKGLPGDAYASRGDEDEARLAKMIALYNGRGLTSIADRSASDTVLKLYRRLRDKGTLNIRVNATRVLDQPPGERTAIIEGLNRLAAPAERDGEPNGPSGVGDLWVRIGPLKLFLDGGMLNGTAYMREPWGIGPTYQITESDYRGLLFVQPKPLAQIAEEAARRGWQMTAHVAGEAAMDELLTAYQHADDVVGIRNRRWLITHANFTSAENLKRCADLGVGADLQPAWLWKDTRTLLKVLGPARMEWFHPYRKWLNAGVTIGGGSDHMIRLDPIEATNPWDPWLGIWIAVTRNTEGGPPLNVDQRLTREEALRLYTINNARLHFEEQEKGTIEPGKLADLVLVDRDPLTCAENDLRSTKVIWTMVGGKMVYEGK